MPANRVVERKSRFSGRRALAWVGGSLAALVVSIVGLSLWLTEPLEPEDVAALEELSKPIVHPHPAREDRSTGSHLAWPDDRLEGDAAKRLLLELLTQVEAKIDRVTGYTATFRKQERIDGRLRDEETLAIKIRHRPFAFYGKFLAPKVGKEVVYAEGHHDNKIIVSGGGMARLLVPRLALDPNSPIALADARHPVTDAGLAHMIRRLVGFRKMDLDDEDAGTILDRWTDPTGRAWLRSVHTHTTRDPRRPFARVEVLYDPSTHFPLRILNFDWTPPEAGADVVGLVAERYSYDDLQLDVPLTALDFDPANPNYAFHRF